MHILLIEDDSRIREIVERGLTAHGFEGVDPKELTAIRHRGWAASVAEREPGVASVSAPVLDGAGRALASVGVSGPIDRLGRDPGPRYAPSVVAAAREIERLTGSVSGP